MDQRPLALAVLLAAAAAAGCADNRTTVEILGRAAPTDVTTCKYSSTGDFLLGPGTLDVSAAAPTYATVLYIKNNAVDPATNTPGAVTDSKAWRALAAKVRVNPSSYVGDFAPSPALLGYAAENVLPMDGMTTPPGGNSSQFVDLLGSGIGAQLKGLVAAGATAKVVLGVTLQGQTLDGAKVDSGEWYMALEVCNGCLAGLTCTAPAVLTPSCFGLYQDPNPYCK